MMAVARSVISIVDDDQSVRESLPDLLNEFGFTVETFASAEEFLASGFIDRTDCLILDVTMPGMSGLELQQTLKSQGHVVPIVFITAHADESIRPLTIAQGAVDCLFKPFNENALLDALNTALGRT